MTESLWNAADLERISCDVCDSPESDRIYVRPDGMQVVKCCGCGVVYVNPRPKAECIRRLYDAGYFRKNDKLTGFGYTDYFDDSQRPSLLHAAELRLAVLSGSWRPRAKRCLEVGCATGEFCSTLVKRGADITGIDLSHAAVAEAARRYPKVKFLVGEIGDAGKGRQYDAIFAFEVIEHAVSPTRFIREARRLLKPGGILVVTTPNVACAQAVGYVHWAGFHTSFEHLFFFDADALAFLLNRHRFRIQKWWTGGGDGVFNPAPRARSRWRALARKALSCVGLLGPYRAIRLRIAPFKGTGYVLGGNLHNLYVLSVREG
jgi:SAM-dependent methyltransferase